MCDADFDMSKTTEQNLESAVEEGGSISRHQQFESYFGKQLEIMDDLELFVSVFPRRYGKNL